MEPVAACGGARLAAACSRGSREKRWVEGLNSDCRPLFYSVGRFNGVVELGRADVTGSQARSSCFMRSRFAGRSSPAPDLLNESVDRLVKIECLFARQVEQFFH